MIVVTGCDKKYSPGVRALHNSIKRNVPEGEIELWCLVYGDQELADEFTSLGIKTILNPVFPDDIHLPVGGAWTAEAMPAMYARLLVPKLFCNHDRVLWLDADTIVLESIKDLENLNLNGHAIAAWPCNTIGSHFHPPKRDNRIAFATGVMLWDVPTWNTNQITEKCFELMNRVSQSEAKTMKGVIENILNMVIPEQFEKLDNIYHTNPKRSDPPPGSKILHFVCLEPWDDKVMSEKPAIMRQSVKKWWTPYAT